jgi:hypothetical protein
VRFQSGDQVRVIRPHTLRGRPYSNECKVGDVGTVIGYERFYEVGDVGGPSSRRRAAGLDEGVVRVEWPEDHWANALDDDRHILGPFEPVLEIGDDWYPITSCLDEKCLEVLPVTDEEVSSAIASIAETAARLQKREVTSIQDEAQGGRDEQETTE